MSMSVRQMDEDGERQETAFALGTVLAKKRAEREPTSSLALLKIFRYFAPAVPKV